MFKKYPSIENSYQSKSIERWLSFFPGLKTEQYIVLEKIHGTNFSIIFEPEKTPFLASRNRILEPDEDFFGLQDAVFAAEHQDLLQKFKDLARDQNMVFQLLGELFGPKVNKGVFYGNKREFRFFDLMRDGLLLPHCEFEAFMSADFQKYRAPSLGIFPNLDAALNIEIEERNSLLTPQNYDKPNTLEGIVIKPYNKIFVSPVGDIFMLKKKTEKFKEVKKKKKTPPGSKDHPLVTELKHRFYEYITDQRLQNVFSKEGVIADKSQISHYIQLLIQDAKQDFLKDPDNLEKLNMLENDPDIPKNSIKKIFNVGSEPFKLLQPYL